LLFRSQAKNSQGADAAAARRVRWLGAIMGALYLAVLLAVGLPFAIKFHPRGWARIPGSTEKYFGRPFPASAMWR